MTQQKYDLVSALTAYEMDELSVEGTNELFQHLVNTGLAWSLQGYYGRTARLLLEAGLIKEPPGAVTSTSSTS